MQAFLGGGYIGCYHYKLFRLLSEKYSKAPCSNASDNFRLKKVCQLTKNILIRCPRDRSFNLATRRRNTYVRKLQGAESLG